MQDLHSFFSGSLGLCDGFGRVFRRHQLPLADPRIVSAHRALYDLRDFPGQPFPHRQSARRYHRAVPWVREDLAFEKQVGGSADQRHHVRLWRVLERGVEDRPVWLGDAAFDRGVGVSHYTGAVTHHIAPDIDAERATLATDLEAAGMVTAKYQVTGVGPTLVGRNGGGDPYYTDGEVWVLRLVENCRKNATPVTDIASPLAIQLKDHIWQAIAQTLRK
ncbi:MAG: LssY C-terminal domain-containing protein [Rhizobiales bacterium]|nr:LssY C-terminal domain-containing protein [Hyphomicrobiales bacterium]